MNKRISLGAAIAFMFIVAAATFSMTMIYSQSLFNKKVDYLAERENIYEKFTEIDRKVRQKYYGTINETQLMDSVARGYLLGIGDPYASYVSAEEFAKQTQNIEGGNVGIGAVLKLNPDGYIAVTEVYPESPAQSVGIMPGDWIVKIGDIDLTTENQEEQLKAIEGPQGTKITMTVRREAEDQVIEITRREVLPPTVYAELIPETDVGYIIITEFDDNTSNQFNRELNRLQNLGCKALVFDLRDNKGGVLRSATRILDRLVPAGSLVTATYRDGTVKVLDTSDANEISLPVVMLTNKGTASASEIFVQVLRDYQKGKSVGVTTSGKGVMQELERISDGSAMNLTVAKYNTPSGENYDGVGIKPDFEVQLPADVTDWKILDYTTDPQIKKALEIADSMKKAAENAAASQAGPDAGATSSAQESAPASSENSSVSVPEAPVSSEPASSAEMSSQPQA